MAADGSNVQQVTSSADDFSPAFSPDGRSIVFGGASGIFITGIDGSGTRQLSHNSGEPTFSPDGRRIAFVRAHGGSVARERGSVDIFVMRADGSHVRQLTHARRGGIYWSPDFSPAGNRIVFLCGRDPASEVCIMRANGTHLRHLTYFGHTVGEPGAGFKVESAVFSPNGRQVALLAQSGCRAHGDCRHHSIVLYTMRADGSHRRKVHAFPASEYPTFEGLSWQPLP